jgi:hypothetical protein
MDPRDERLLSVALATVESFPSLSQRPVYGAADFVSRPLNASWVRPGPNTGGAWADALVLSASVGRVSVIKQYVATCDGLMPPTMSFRMRLRGRILTDVVIGPSDRCKRSAADYPVLWQTIFIPVLERDDFAIQYRNDGPAVNLILGIAGWMYLVKDTAEPNGGLTGRSEDSHVG